MANVTNNSSNQPQSDPSQSSTTQANEVHDFNPDYSSDDPTINPKANPLKQFRTYSYRFVHIVSDSTQIIQNLMAAGGSDMNIYTHPDLIGEGPRFGLKTLGGSKGLPESKYVIISNTATDSNIVFKSVYLRSYFGGGTSTSENTANPPGTTGNPSDELKMTLIEPFGVRYVEYILGACNQLNMKSSGQAIHVLKVFFVGHKSDGTVEILSGYNPITFAFTSISMDFTSSQTTYTIEAVPTMNAGASLPTASMIGTSTFTVHGGTFKDFVDNFNRILQKDSADTQKKLDEEKKNEVAPIYTITIAPTSLYQTKDYIVQDQVHDKNKEENPDNWTMCTAVGSQIQDLIMHAFATCKKALEDQKPTEYDKNGIATTYIPNIFTYTKQFVNAKGQIQTQYLYEIQKVPKTVFKSTNDQAETKSDSTSDSTASNSSSLDSKRFNDFLQQQLSRANLLEFDFVFSGINDDIIDYQMVMTNGLALLSNTVTPPQNLSQKTQTSTTPVDGVKKNTNQVPDDKSTAPESKSNTTTGSQPQLVRYTKSLPLKDPSSYQMFLSMMRTYTQYEVAQTTITIMGNPRLFDQCTINPKLLIDTTQGPSKEDYMREVPAYAKINVFMPQIDPNTGYVNFETIPERGFRNPFWYDGIFQIYVIENFFDDGIFKQKLTLLPNVTSDAVSDVYTEKDHNMSSSPGTNGKRTASDAKSASNVKQKNSSTSKCVTRGIPVVLDGTDGGTGSTNVKAFLKTIRFAEGTAAPDGWTRVVNGKLTNSGTVLSTASEAQAYANAHNLSGSFNSTGYSGNIHFTGGYSKHPNAAIHWANGQPTSSAAGAYQFLYKTWNGIVSAKHLPDFSPVNQDIGAVYLINGRGALTDVKQGRFEDAIEKCQLEWASLGPHYGQGYICIENLKAAYEKYGGTYIAS
jgi:lysozyme